MRRHLWLAVCAGLIAGVASACAPAPTLIPRLIAIWPAAGAPLPVEPQTFELTFNRGLQPDASWVAVWREDDGAPEPSDGHLVAANPRQFELHLPAPTAGRHRLRWH